MRDTTKAILMFSFVQAILLSLFFYGLINGFLLLSLLAGIASFAFHARGLDDIAPFDDGRLAECGPCWSIRIIKSEKAKSYE